MMNWVNICEEAALPNFGGIAAWFENKAIAIFNLGERGLFALAVFMISLIFGVLILL